MSAARFARRTGLDDCATVRRIVMAGDAENLLEACFGEAAKNIRHQFRHDFGTDKAQRVQEREEENMELAGS